MGPVLSLIHVSHTFDAKTDATDGSDHANFQAGDTFTAADGNTYTFGTEEGQIAIGADFDKSMANLTAAMNAKNAGIAYDAGMGETKTAAGSWRCV